MHNRKICFIALAATALLVLAGCGSYYGDNPYGVYRSADIRGTIDYVDTATRSIVLTNTNRGMYSSSDRDGVRVYYDRNTRVTWNGRSYRPEDLDRGDEVDVRASNSNGHLFADTVMVTYNSSTAGPGPYAAPGSSYPAPAYPNGSYPNGSYSSMINGTVTSVDTSRHAIGIDRGNGGTTWIEYDTNTSVLWNGRSYMPGDLEPGDQVSINTYDMGNGRVRATSVSVTRSISDRGTYNGPTASSYATLRGTVRFVDSNAHTIELEQPTWLQGFNDNRNTESVVVQYGSGAQVDVSGVMNPVTGLERGDIVEVQVSGNPGAWYASRITLVRNVRQR